MKKGLFVFAMLSLAFNSYGQIFKSIEEKASIDSIQAAAKADSIAAAEAGYFASSGFLHNYFGIPSDISTNIYNDKLKNQVLRDGIFLISLVEPLEKNYTDYRTYTEAVNKFTLALDFKELNSNKIALRLIYILRGIAKNRLKDYRGAILDFDKFISLTPEQTIESEIEGGLKMLAAAYSFRGMSKRNLNYPYQETMIDHNKAIKLNPKDGLNYLRRAITRQKFNLKNEACLDFSKAGELGISEAYEIIRDYCN
jgi:tetratricopeptide (TPR) repeat protein